MSKGSTVKPQGLTLALKSLLAEQDDHQNDSGISRDVEKKHRKAIMSRKEGHSTGLSALEKAGANWRQPGHLEEVH